MYPSEELEEPTEREIAEGVRATDIRGIVAKPQTEFNVSPAAPRKKLRMISVQYKAKSDDIARLKKCLRKPSWSAGRIGKHALMYLLEQECPE